MKKFIAALIITAGFCTGPVSSQSIIQIGVSRPYAVLSFMESAAGTKPHSFTLQRFIDSAVTRKDAAFKNLVRDFRGLRLEYHYKRDEYPARRRQHRSTYDLITIAAVRSKTLAEFATHIIGILPNGDYQRLIKLLTAAEPFYQSVIGKPYEKDMNEHVKALTKFQPAANKLFEQFRSFYRSDWSQDIPFHVSLFPIPGRQGSSSATPHANSLCVGVLTGERDRAGRMGVIMHEMCHVLFDEQPVAVQQEIDSAFSRNASPFKNMAYDFFDEAVATALGNGWAFEQFSGHTDTTEWYNNEYIDGFAHGIYPLVRSYLQEGRSMDQAFIDSAISIFGKLYPKSATDYSILLNNMFLYADAATGEERNQLKMALGKQFQSSRYSFSSPVLHEYSLESLKSSKGTQLIVIDRDHPSVVATLTNTFPQLSAILSKKDENFIYSFIDSQNRPVIIVHVQGSANWEKGFRALRESKYLDPLQPLTPVR